VSGAKVYVLTYHHDPGSPGEIVGTFSGETAAWEAAKKAAGMAWDEFAEDPDEEEPTKAIEWMSAFNAAEAECGGCSYTVTEQTVTA
jgi:hypothetical protein